MKTAARNGLIQSNHKLWEQNPHICKKDKRKQRENHPLNLLKNALNKGALSNC